MSKRKISLLDEAFEFGPAENWKTSKKKFWDARIR
jgi:hypothetical protein